MISKAIFLGSKSLGLTVLKSLVKANDKVEWKILCPNDLGDPRNNFDDFEDFANRHSIEIKIVNSNKDILDITSSFRPQIIFGSGYYRILSNDVLNSVPLGIYGIHNSILPKYRGGSPLVWQLINGEKIVGATLFKLEEGMDEGGIVATVKIKNDNLEISKVLNLLEKEWEKVLPKIWKNFCNDEITLIEQNHKQATYCSQRNEDDGEINWNNSSEYIDRFIKAQSYPYPLAYVNYKNQKLKISKHEIEKRKIHGEPGQVFETNDNYVVVCCENSDAIRILEITVDGKPVKPNKYINSFKIRL